MSDILYVESGYVEAGYFEVIKSPGASTLSASATLECVATKGFPDQRYVEDGYVEAGYFAVTKGLLEETLSSSFSVTVEDGETLEFDASLSAAFSTTADIIRIQEFSASLSVVASASGDVNGTKGFEASLAATASQTTSGGTIKQASCDAGSLFTPTLTAEALKNHTAVLDSQFDITTTISKFAGNEATLANIINLSLQGDRSRAAAASATSSFSQSTTPNKILNTTADLDSAFFSTVDAIIPVDFSASISDEFTIVARPISYELRTLPYNRPNNLEEYIGYSSNTGTSFITYNQRTFFGTSYTDYLAEFDSSSATQRHALRAELTQNNTTNLSISANEDFYLEFIYKSPSAISHTGEICFLSLKGGTSNAGLNTANYFNGSNYKVTDMDGVVNIGVKNKGIYAEIQTTNGLKTIGPVQRTDALGNLVDFNFTSGKIILRRSGSTITLFHRNDVQESITESGAINNFHTLGIYDFTAGITGNPEVGRLLFKKDDSGPSNLNDVASEYNPSYFLGNDENTIIYAEFDQSLDDSTINWTQETSASLSSVSSLEANAGVTLDATVLQASTGTLSADVNVTRNLSSTQNAMFSQTTSAGLLQSGASSLSAIFTQNTDSIRFANVDSNLASNFGIDITASKLHSTAQADLDALYSKLTAVSKIGDFFVNADSAFAQTTVAQSTLRTPADLDVNATLSADVIIEVSADSSASAQFAQSADGVRIRFGNSVLTSSFAFSANAVKTTDTDSTLTAQANQNTEAQVIRADSVLATSTVTTTITADRIRLTDGALNANTSVTVVGIKSVEANATPNAQFTSQIDANRIRAVETDFDSIASQLSAVSKIGDFLVSPQVVASLSATANVTTGTVVVMESVSSVSAGVDRIRDASSAQSTTATVQAQGISSKDAAGVLASTSTLVATASVTVDFVADIADAADFTITATATRNNELQFDSAFSASADVEIVRGFEALPASNSTLSVGATRILSGSASLSTEISIAAQGRLLILVDELTHVIQSETREFQIASETREYQLLNETRTYIVPGG